MKPRLDTMIATACVLALALASTAVIVTTDGTPALPLLHNTR